MRNQIKYLLQNKDIVEILFSQANFDKYKCHLVLKHKNLVLYIPKCSFTRQDVISFVNNHFVEICANQVIAFVAFSFISKKQKGIDKKVFIEYAQKQPYLPSFIFNVW